LSCSLQPIPLWHHPWSSPLSTSLLATFDISANLGDGKVDEGFLGEGSRLQPLWE
jgi:hypothetical protein